MTKLSFGSAEGPGVPSDPDFGLLGWQGAQ
jgi:hypothetical protein